MLQSSDNQSSESRSAMNFQRLLAAFMGGMLSRLPNEAQEFWELAMDPQAATRPTPASQKAIDGLPTNQVQPLERILVDRCTVCQENYQVGEKITSLPCNHKFHKDCLVQWLHQRDTCPLCRYKLTEKEDLKESGNDTESKGEVLAIEAPTSESGESRPMLAWSDSKASSSSIAERKNVTSSTPNIVVIPSQTRTRPRPVSGTTTNVPSTRPRPVSVPFRERSEEARCCIIS